jgi:hypothetical protein
VRGKQKNRACLTQQEIIALLDALCPVCSIALEFVEAFLVVRSVEVSAGEVIPMVLLFRVLITSTREVEANPSFDFVWIGERCVLVIFVDLNGLDLFLLVC